jgi:hypothetical protein
LRQPGSVRCAPARPAGTSHRPYLRVHPKLSVRPFAHMNSARGPLLARRRRDAVLVPKQHGGDLCGCEISSALIEAIHAYAALAHFHPRSRPHRHRAVAHASPPSPSPRVMPFTRITYLDTLSLTVAATTPRPWCWSETSASCSPFSDRRQPSPSRSASPFASASIA